MKDYNLFEIYEKKKGVQINLKSTNFIVALVLILCVLISVGVVGRNMYYSYTVDNLTNEADQIKQTTEYIEANKLQESINAMNLYDLNAELISKSFKVSNVIVTDKIEALSIAIPSTVIMTSFTMDNANASFNFIVPNRKAAAELLLSLKDSGLFEEVFLGSVVGNSAGGGLNASMTAIMKAGVIK